MKGDWYGSRPNKPINFTDPTGLVMDYANGGSGTYWGAKEDRPVNDSRVTPDEGPEQGPTELKKVEIKQPTIYYDNYGNPSTDPHVVTGRNVGDFGYTAKDVFDLIVSVIENAGLMGKKYKDGEYVCTNFLKDTINLIGLSMKEYFPGPDNRVSNSVKLFNEKDYLKPEKGQNPGVGVYVFYKVYDNGIDGHAGVVYFDVEGNASILHNGLAKGGNEKVNIYERNNSDFNTFFPEDQRKNDVIYKQIYASHILPTY